MTDYERRSLSSRTVNIFHIKSYNKTLFLVLPRNIQYVHHLVHISGDITYDVIVYVNIK